MSIITNINDSDLRSFKVNDEIVVDKNVIGEFIKNSAQLTILNKNHTYDFLEKTYLNINKFGLWYVDDLKNNEESVEANLTLSDLSIKFDEDYEDIFSFPATLGEWATWIGNKTGVPLKGTFLNSSKVLKEKPYLGNNPKYRTAVKIIAKYACGWAEVNEDETYSIRWFDDSIEEIEDWESFKHGNETSATNILILSTGVTEDNVRYPEQIPTTPHELRIEDDWLAIDRYDISEPIFEQINGFLYTPITELTLPYGLLEFKVGQKIRAKDIELNDIETYITSHSLNWDGGDWEDPNSWTSTLKMNELKETTTKYQYSNSIESRVGRTEVNCDKNNKKINMLVEDVDVIEKDITISKTANGNPIEVTDAGEYPLDQMVIEGKSYQKFTTGKNKLPIEARALTQNGVSIKLTNQEVILNGTVTEQIDLYLFGLWGNSTPKFTIEGDYVLKLGGNTNENIKLFIINTSAVVGQVTTNELLNNYNNQNITSAFIRIPKGTILNNITLIPMLYEGTSIPKVEKYTGGIPSPNSNYPQEIETVQGVTNYFTLGIEETSNIGISAIFNKSEFILDGTTNAAGNILSKRDNIGSNGYRYIGHFKPGTYYINSTKISGEFTVPGGSFAMYFRKSDNTTVFTISKNLSGSQLITLTEETDLFLQIYANASGIIFNKYKVQIQIESGNKANRYVPYGRWLEQIAHGKNFLKWEDNFSVSANNTFIKNVNAFSTTILTEDLDSMILSGDFSLLDTSLMRVAYSNECPQVGIEYVRSNNLTSNSQIIKINKNYKYVTFIAIRISSSSYEMIKNSFQLEKGTISTEYEEYKENSALIDMNKPNLFDKENFLQGTLNTDSSIRIIKFIKKVLKGETYTIVNNKSDLNFATGVYSIGTQGNGTVTNDSSWRNDTYTLTASQNGWLYLLVKKLDDAVILPDSLNNDDFIIYEGYEPYYEFAEEDEFLDGDFTDNVQKWILTGTENFVEGTWGNNVKLYRLTCPNMIKDNDKVTVKCTHAVGVANKDWMSNYKSKDIVFGGSNQLLQFVISSITTLANFKSFLAQQYDNGTPVIVYYKLADSKTYQLKYEPLKLFKGYNYITLNDDLYPNMKIKYLTDSKFNADYATKSELNMKSNEITMGVNSKLKNYSTTTETSAMIQEKVEKESASINLSVTQKIDDIQIGGRNLLVGTETHKTSGTSTGTNQTTELYKFSQFFNDTYKSKVDTTEGLEVTCSFDWETTGATGSFYIQLNNYPYTALSKTITASSNNKKGHSVYTAIMKKYNANATAFTKINIRRDNMNTSVTISNMKIEIGNKGTDWSPAPEDMATNSNVEAKLELKVGTTDYNKIISMINAAADVITLDGGSKINITTAGKLLISAGNFKLDANGNINCTGGTIGGFTLSKDKFSSNASGIYTYSYDDLRLCMNVYRGNLSVDSSIKKVLDYSNNGSIDLGDASSIARVLSGDISNTKTASGKFEIDSNNPKHFVSVKDGDKVVASIGLGGINSMIGSFQTICVSNATNTSDTTGVFINGSNGTVVATGEIKTGDRKVITSTYQNNQKIGSIGMVYGTKDYVEVLTGNGAYGIDAWASDKRLKRRVKDSKYNALDTIMKIKHRQFIYRKSNEKVLVGYVADELQEIDKQLIFEVGPQKIKQPSQSYIIPVLSKAIQEQQEIIETQNKRITELETQVKKLLELVEGKKEV